MKLSNLTLKIFDIDGNLMFFSQIKKNLILWPCFRVTNTGRLTSLDCSNLYYMNMHEYAKLILNKQSMTKET